MLPSVDAGLQLPYRLGEGDEEQASQDRERGD
jgi:hypothetical protein